MEETVPEVLSTTQGRWTLVKNPFTGRVDSLKKVKVNTKRRLELKIQIMYTIIFPSASF